MIRRLDADSKSVPRIIAALVHPSATLSGEAAPLPGDGRGSAAWARRLRRLTGGWAETHQVALDEVIVRERLPVASGWARLIGRTAGERIVRLDYAPLDEPPEGVGRPNVDDARATVELLAASGAFAGVVRMASGGTTTDHAFGAANQRRTIANTATTRFNIASLTKPLTAAGVWRLIEAGALDVRRSVADYLGRDGRWLGDVDTRQLLTHTSGLPEAALSDDEYDTYRTVALSGVDYLALMAARPPRSGAHGYAYSNAGYAVLGAVIEAVTGLRYADHMAQALWRPAGMTATSLVADDRAAIGYAYSSDGATAPTRANDADRLTFGTPYGYAYSTIGDITAFLSAIRGEVLLGDSGQRALLTPAVPTGQPGRFATHGLFVESFAGRRLVTMTGAGPGISAWLDLDPDTGDQLIILSNAPKPAAHRVGRHLRLAVFSPRP